MNNKVKFLRGTSGEYAVAEKDSDAIYFTTDDGKLYIGDKEVSGSDVTVDTALSDTSENPVQNKVVKQAIDNKADKTVATTEADGLMSAKDKGKLDAFEITTTGGKLHDKDIAVDVANPNLLINPDFKINQRAVSGTFSDAGKYFVDRWKLDSGTVTVHTNGTLTLNGTMSQILENAAGTDVTASVSAGAAAYDDSTKTFTITGDGAVISWVKLERGGIATAFVPPDPAMEQMKCYRFFYRVGGKGIANPNDLSNSNRIAYHTSVNVWVSAIFQFPVEMRVVPTAKITGTPWCFKELHSTKSDVAGELNMDLGIGVAITAETSGYEIRMITDYLRTLKTPDGYVGPSNSTGYTDFDAEIY